MGPIKGMTWSKELQTLSVGVVGGRKTQLTEWQPRGSLCLVSGF